MLATLLTSRAAAQDAPNAADAWVDQEDPFEEIHEAERDRSPDREPIELMNRDDLGAAGFDFGESRNGRDTSSALLISLTAGAFVHGMGHFYVGETRTGAVLLGVELASLAAIAGSLAFLGVSETASPWSAAFGPLAQAGLAGFAFSYLADVLGMLTLATSPPKSNSDARRGVGISARYLLLSVPSLSVRHAIDGAVTLNTARVYAQAATTQDVYLDLASYRGLTGVRLLQGAEPLTFLAVEARGDYLSWQGPGEFGRIGVEGRTVLSYQFGERVPHLGELAVGLTGGVGNRWLQIAPAGETKFRVASSRLWIPFDSWASLNVSRNVNVRAGYGTPEVTFVPSTHALLGVAHADLNYRSEALGDLSLRVEVGEGVAVWLGGGVWLGP